MQNAPHSIFRKYKQYEPYLDSKTEKQPIEISIEIGINNNKKKRFNSFTI